MNKPFQKFVGLTAMAIIAFALVGCPSWLVPSNVGNNAPVLGPIGDRVVTLGDALQILVAASDRQTEFPLLTAAPLPAGATFVDHGNGTGALNWQTDCSSNPGAYQVTFTATDDDGLIDAETITISVNGDAGSLILPLAPTPLQVGLVGNDELSYPVSRNADLSTGTVDWYQFTATAGAKYYILARGNAPVIVSVYKKDLVCGVEAATMLWTTDPEAPIDFYFLDYDGFKANVTVEKSVHIPSFVANTAGTYYVTVQAAKIDITTCLDCLDEDVDAGLYEIAYYDVSSYTIQVDAKQDASTAELIETFDPALGETGYVAASITTTQDQWFSFMGVAGQDYMIELPLTDPGWATEPYIDDQEIWAYLYGPTGQVDCEWTACPTCCPTPFHAPADGEYYIQVTYWPYYYSGGSAEWGQADFMIGVLEDDHGNLPGLATAVNAPGAASGYLSSHDADWVEFQVPRLSTYLVSTSGTDIDLVLGSAVADDPYCGDAVPAVSGCDANIDAIGNEAMIVQNWNVKDMTKQLGVMASRDGSHFGLLKGVYTLDIMADDYPDYFAANVSLAPELAVSGTAANGVLWDYDNDMFKFTGQADFWYKLAATGAEALWANGILVAAWDGIDVDKKLEAYYPGPAGTDPVKLAVANAGETPGSGSGAMECNTREDNYTVSVLEEDHGNTVDSATELALPSDSDTGTLWGETGDFDVFKFDAPAFTTTKVTLAGEDAEWPGMLAYGEPVDNTFIYAFQNATEELKSMAIWVGTPVTDADVPYSVAIEADDQPDAVTAAPTAEELAALTGLTEAATAGVLFGAADNDLFIFTPAPNTTSKVMITGEDVVASIAWASATVAPAPAGEAAYAAADPTSQQYALPGAPVPTTDRVALVKLATAGPADHDVDYSVSVKLDDYVDAAATTAEQDALIALGATDKAGLLFKNDVDLFKFAATGTNCKIQVSATGGPVTLTVGANAPVLAAVTPPATTPFTAEDLYTGAAGTVVVAISWAGTTDVDITYTVKVLVDDHVDDPAHLPVTDIKQLTVGGAAVGGEIWADGDVDVLRFTTEVGATYNIVGVNGTGGNVKFSVLDGTVNETAGGWLAGYTTPVIAVAGDMFIAVKTATVDPLAAGGPFQIQVKKL